jgi:hypothetical protein
MLEFLEQMPGYEWQIGIGFLLLLTGAAAGSVGSRNAQGCNFAFTARAISDCPKPAVQFLGSSFRNCTHTHRDHSESYCHALEKETLRKEP